MEAQTEPRLLFPKLKPFYDWAAPLTWPLIRLTVGLMIIPHGWPKLMAGVTATAQFALAKRGIAPAEPLAVVLIIDRKSTRLNSSHSQISYAVFCLKKKNKI